MSQQKIGYAGQLTKWDEFPRHHYDKGVVKYDMTAIPTVERRPRGRKGLVTDLDHQNGGLFELVSSKYARDIKRKKDWIADEPFKLWEKKHRGPDNKQMYWGALEDYDNDGYPIEYVVRRGSAQGPIVAVNGYTTTQSDYPWRYQYFQDNPTKEDRKLQSFKQWVSKYYAPQYGSDNMTITGWNGADPKTDDLTIKALEHKYKNVVPKSKSPYRAFSEIIHKVLNEHILEMAKGNTAEAKEIRKQLADLSGKGMGFASSIVSAVYDSFINGPIFDALQTHGMMNQYKQAYEAIQKDKDPSYKFDENDDNKVAAFNKWLMSKADWKKAAKNLAIESVSNENRNATMATLKQLISESINLLLSSK